LNAITLPETFADFELSLPDIDLDALPEAEDGLMDLNQIRQRELITLRPEVEGRGRRAVPEEDLLIAPASQDDLWGVRMIQPSLHRRLIPSSNGSISCIAEYRGCSCRFFSRGALPRRAFV
jgi:hypothetical protein